MQTFTPFGGCRAGTWAQRCGVALATFAVAVLATNPIVAQEAEDADEEDADQPVEIVVVTGSRLAREPSELSRDVIVLDRDAIVASGELTLPRLLRQLPQNINATNETFGSDLNGVTNVTGASTVNLRGFGSESTLILVDGRRVGYSGILGGVTDISTIPLSMVERVEIILDGASAIYGSDAVGGVVNIITRKDYTGIDVSVDYGRPHKPGYDEIRASISGGWNWSGARMVAGFEHFYDSGLDSSQRESEIGVVRRDRNNQKFTAAGPQIRAFSTFFDNECNAEKAVVYVFKGRVITREAFDALSAEDQYGAECHSDVTLPADFQPGDDLNGIEIFGPPDWGDAVESGYSLRPEQSHNVINVGVDYDISDSLAVRGNVRFAAKETTSNTGLSIFSSWLNQDNPHNPFGHRVTLRGQVLNGPPRHFASDKEDLHLQLGASGALGVSGWIWQAEFGRAQEDIDAQRFNVFDIATVAAGFDSDGVTPTLIRSISGITEDECAAAVTEFGGNNYEFTPPRGFFGSSCRVYGAAPDPINPFGDLTSYIVEDLSTISANEQTQFEAFARGELFEVGGGTVAVSVGYDYRHDVLDTLSEFFSPSSSGCSALGCPDDSPAGNAAFNTRIERDTHAAFFEGSVPLVREANARPGIDSLTVTFSGRYDSYSNVDVEFRDDESGEAGVDKPSDPGAEFTWSFGVAYRPNEALELKADTRTAFVAPQLNQLIQKTKERSPAGAFRGLYFIAPDSQGRTQTHNNVFNNIGGNDKLLPETADAYSISAEWFVLPGLSLKAAWSDTVFVNRIAYFSSLVGIDPDNLPANVMYFPDEDIYVKDERYINVSSLERSGLDLSLDFDLPTEFGDFSVTLRRSQTEKFKVVVDAAADEAQSLVKVKDNVTSSRDALLAAVPKYSAYGQVTFTRGGFSLSLDAQAAGSTSTIRPGGENAYIYRTEPATIVDMVAVYDFGQDTFFNAPAWMDDLQATFTINNVTDAFARNTLTDRAILEAGLTGHTEVNQINPVYEWTQGRAYRLTISKSLAL